MDNGQELPADLKAIVVDDHDFIRKAVAKILDKLKIKTIFEASSFAEAKKIMDGVSIDLCISDIYLHQSSGFDLLRLIRSKETRADIPILIVTGEGSKEDIVKAADLGCDDYLLKPFQVDELEKKIVRLLNSYFFPSKGLAFVRQAEKKYVEKDFQAAKDLTGKALHLDAQSVRAHHLYALIFDKLGESQKAIRMLKANVERAPSYYKNYTTLADIYYRLKQIKECIQALKIELEYNPKQVSRQILLAKLLRESGDHLGAIEHYRLALIENPKNRNGLFGMARTYAEMSNTEKALYYLKRVRRYFPNDTASLKTIVNYALEANQARMAEVILKDEKKSFPKRFDTYIILSQLYLVQERHDDATALLLELQKVDPANIDSKKLLGIISMKSGKIEEAIAYFKEFLASSPDINTGLMLAEAFVIKGLLNDALQIVHGSIRGENCPAKAWEVLGKIYLKTEQFGKAALLARKFALLQTGAVGEWQRKAFEGVEARRRSPVRAIAS